VSLWIYVVWHAESLALGNFIAVYCSSLYFLYAASSDEASFGANALISDPLVSV